LRGPGPAGHGGPAVSISPPGAGLGARPLRQQPRRAGTPAAPWRGARSCRPPACRARRAPPAHRHGHKGDARCDRIFPTRR